ncbi:MAG: hypothetical protein JKX76_03300 [Colwellia sp.]|nr:hypothetical protein [Colwellia sp.]
MHATISHPGITRFLPPLGYLEADTATGKTSATCLSVIGRSRFNIQIVVCEKKTLLDQWEEGLTATGMPPCKVKKIHSDCPAYNKKVNHEVQQWLDTHTSLNKNPVGVAGASGILLITQATLKSLTKLNRKIKGKCDIWFDELISVDQEHRIRVKNNPMEVKQFIRLGDDPVAHCKTKIPVIEDGDVVLKNDGEMRRETVDDTLHVVEPVCKGALGDELRNKGQNYNQSVRGLLTAVHSENETVYIKRSQWGLMDVKLNKADDEDFGSTFFLSMLSRKLLSGWNSLTVISADFTRSKFYYWMAKRHDLSFISHRQTKRTLTNSGYHTEKWIQRTTFVYAIHDNEKRRNSTGYLNDNGDRIDLSILREVKMLDQRFLLCTNTKRKGNRELVGLENCTVITSKDHGSNSFMDRNVLVFDAALNHKPDHQAMLELLGFTSEVIYDDMTLNVLYQIASRTSLRNEESNEPVTIFCMDSGSAKALARRFAANNQGQVMKIRHIDETAITSTPLDAIGGVEVIASTPLALDEKQVPQATWSEATNMGINVANGVSNYIGHADDCEPSASGCCAPTTSEEVVQHIENHSHCNKSGHYNYLGVRNICKTTNHETSSDSINSNGNHTDTRNIKDSTIGCAKSISGFSYLSSGKNVIKETVTENCTVQQFVKRLKISHSQQVHNCDCRERISPGVLASIDSGMDIRRRKIRKNNSTFSHANVMVLDFDGNEQSNFEGSISPKKFEKLFSPKRQSVAKNTIKHSYVICSRHDTSDQNPFKFRVFMFFKQPANSIEEYAACYRYVNERLSQHGFSDSGLNPNSQNPTQTYCVPGTNVNHIDNAYFEVHETNTSRNISLYGLNPAELLVQHPSIG